MLGSTFIRIYFHAYVYLFEYFNSRIINITPASMCSCPCCRILVMILTNYKNVYYIHNMSLKVLFWHIYYVNRIIIHL